MNILSIFVIPGIVFILTLAFGFWLSRRGKPYNGLLFNIHKLAALAAVIITVFQLVRTLNGADLSAFSIVSLAMAAICVVALFLSGALMSAGKFDHAWLHTIHRIALVLLFFALPAVIFLTGRRP